MKKIVVLVKQVPDTKNIVGEAMKADGTINRAALPTIFNPEDLHALEMALAIKDKTGAFISVMTMGPSSAVDVLRESLYRGADQAYLLSDRRFAAADTLATSYVLAQAILKLGDVDIVFAGRQAIDGDTAQVGPQVSQFLNYSLITYADQLVDVLPEEAIFKRQIDGGYEIVRGKAPFLVTVVDTAPKARPRDLAATVLKRKVTIPIWGADEIGADPMKCGLNGSPTNVYKIASVSLTAENRDATFYEDLSQLDVLVTEMDRAGYIRGKDHGQH